MSVPINPQPNEREVSPVVAADVTEDYINDEIITARRSLKNTKIYGTLILLLLGGETVIVTAKFSAAMQPTQAAQIASGFAREQLDQHSDELQAQIAQRVPELIRQTPDYMIQQMPSYRDAIENKAVDSLSNYCAQTKTELGTHMDAYLAANSADMKAILDGGSSPTADADLGKGLQKEMLAYLKEKPATGASVSDQIDQSLTSLHQMEKTVHRLATATDLSPQEKQTRRALAIITHTVNQEKLQPIPVETVIAKE